MDKVTKKQYTIDVEKFEDNVPIYQTDPQNPIRYEKNLSPSVTQKLVQGVPGAFTLDNVLTQQECQQFIDATEQMGFDLARISTFAGMVKDTSTRNNTRVMWHVGTDTWEPIWQRIQNHVPGQCNVRGQSWKAYGLNERFRFYRYHKGQQFVRHYDGCYPRSSNDMSLLTCIIYLNDNFAGGHTTFFPNRSTPIKVQPKCGSALLFWHGSHTDSPLHEGSTCDSGAKYVLRSDVMFNGEGYKQ